MELSVDTTSTSMSAESSIGSVDITASASTGTSATVSASLQDNTLEASVSYSDVTRADVTVDASLHSDKMDASANASVTAYVQTGTDANASIHVGKQGVNGSAEVSSGSSAGVDGSVKVQGELSSVQVTSGVSVGEDHVGVGGGAEATYHDGTLAVSVSGDVAAIVGLDVDVHADVNVQQTAEETLRLYIESQKKANDEVIRLQEQEAIARKIAAEESRRVANEAKRVEEESKQLAKRSVKSVKKWFKW